MLPPSTIAMYRTNTFFSLGLMPIFMGLSHLTPAIGAIRTATGSYQFPGGLFGLIGAITIVVDCMFPHHLKSRPKNSTYRFSFKVYTDIDNINSIGQIQRHPITPPAFEMGLEKLAIRPFSYCVSVYSCIRTSSCD